MNVKGYRRTMLVKIRFSTLFLALLLLSLVHLPASNAHNTEPFKFFRDYVGLISTILDGQNRLARRGSIETLLGRSCKNLAYAPRAS